MNIQDVIKALEGKGYDVSYFETKEEAMSREYAIKQMSRSEKETLIQ